MDYTYYKDRTMKSLSKPFTRKVLISSLLGLSIVSCMSMVHAQSYQRYTNINYSNPAALRIVKNYQIMLGGSTILFNAQFNGSFGGTPGSITSRTTNFLPYGRIAVRLNPRVVVALDITQPLFLDFDYPSPSFIDTASIKTRLRSVDYSPRVSWAVNDQLSLGAGLNFNNVYDATFTFRVAPLGTLANRGSSWGLGWNVGALYSPKLGTYAGLSYYSKIVQHISGKSTWGPLVNNYNKASIPAPAVINASLTQFVSKKWLFNANVRYVFWDTLRYLNIQNSALPGANKTITIPEFFYNNFVYSLGTKYDINETWSALGYVEVNPKPQALAYRGLGFVSSTAFIFGVGGEYTIQEGLKAKFTYGHSSAVPQINRRYATGLALGRANLVGNSFDLAITYDA